MAELTVEQVRLGVEKVARVLMATLDEPIPPFETRYKGVLESCIAAPFQTFGGQDMYEGVYHKASALFYFLIKNHPFVNGNKRIAVVTLLFYLAKNNLAISVTSESLYNIAVLVAESEAQDKDLNIEAFARALQAHIIPLNEWFDRFGRPA